MRSSHDEDERRLFQDVRQRFRREPRPIGEIVSQLITRRGYANIQTTTEWTDVWKSAAGTLALHTRPGKYSGGVLEIIVDNSATLQELTFLKKKLIAAIGRLTPQSKLKDLRFKVGQIQ